MKKTILLLIGILAISTCFAQEKGEDVEEKYYAQKVAYLTTEMDLSVEESAAFWPLYNEHEKKQNVLKEDMKGLRKKIHSEQFDLTEDESLQALLDHQSQMTQMNQLQIKYQNKYLEVISAQKVLLMLKAEKDFRRNLLRKLGDRRQHQNRRDVNTN